MSLSLLENSSEKLDSLRARTSVAAATLRDFTKRIELILSQDHKNISVRDTDFSDEFLVFCTHLRKEFDGYLDFWQEARSSLRALKLPKEYASVLAAKSFSLKAKTLSRTTDDFTTAYDEFNRFYKKYTLAKLPVWILTSCCDDLNNLTGKILFLSRDLSKRTEGA